MVASVHLSKKPQNYNGFNIWMRIIDWNKISTKLNIKYKDNTNYFDQSYSLMIVCCDVYAIA